MKPVRYYSTGIHGWASITEADAAILVLAGASSDRKQCANKVHSPVYRAHLKSGKEHFCKTCGNVGYYVEIGVRHA